MDALVKHPLGALVEYPKTGATTKQSVAHIFRIDQVCSSDQNQSFSIPWVHWAVGHAADLRMYSASSSMITQGIQFAAKELKHHVGV